MPYRARTLNNLSLGCDIAWHRATSSPWSRDVLPALQSQGAFITAAGDERGCAWQLAPGTCLCFPRQTPGVLNQPTNRHKLCLLFRATDPTELTRQRVFTQIY